MRMWLPLVLCLPGLVSTYACNYLDSEHRRTAQKDWSRLPALLTSEECRPQDDRWTLYGCVTRVDRGELRMGCYNGERDLRNLCRNALWNWHTKCNYEERTPMGSTHKHTGYGAYCCVGPFCNRLPPYWLLSLSPDEFNSSPERDLGHVCFILVTVTTLTALFALLAASYHFLGRLLARIVPKSKKQQLQETSDERPFNSLDLALQELETNRLSEQKKTAKEASEMLTLLSTPKTAKLSQATPEKSTQRTGRWQKTPDRRTSTPQNTMQLPSPVKRTSAACFIGSEPTQGSSMPNMKTPDATEPTQKE